MQLETGQDGDLALNHVAEEHVQGVENVVILGGSFAGAPHLPNGQDRTVIHIVVKVGYHILII